jgi:peptidoglycan/LPS O-acetylase OafA/YrhL
MQDNTVENNLEDNSIKEISTPTLGNPNMANRLIKGYIIFMALMNAVASILLFNTYRDLSTHSDPNLPHWPFLLLSLMGLGALAALYGLWNWKRWGFITYLAITGVSLLITLTVLGLAPSPMSLVGLGVFLAVFAPRWKQLS